MKQILRPDHLMQYGYGNTKQLALILAPKCGSTSVRRTLSGLHPIVSRETLLRYTTRLGIIRHPFDRLVSAWRYGWSDVEPQKFIERVLHDPYYDAHFAPYSVRMRDVTCLRTLETASSWWPEIGTIILRDKNGHIPHIPSLEHHNSTDRANVPQPFLDHFDNIIDCYRADFDLWTLWSPL